MPPCVWLNPPHHQQLYCVITRTSQVLTPPAPTPRLRCRAAAAAVCSWHDAGDALCQAVRNLINHARNGADADALRLLRRAFVALLVYQANLDGDFSTGGPCAIAWAALHDW